MGWERVAANQVPEPVAEELLDLGFGAWGLSFLGSLFGVGYLFDVWKGLRGLKKLGLGLSGIAFWAWSSDDEDVQTKSGVYQCGICREVGHNRRTCGQNVICPSCNDDNPSNEKFKLENPESDDSVMVCENCVCLI